MKQTTLMLGKNTPNIFIKEIHSGYSCAQEIVEVELSEATSTSSIILEEDFWKICPAKFTSSFLADYVINPTDFWNLMLANGLNLFSSDRGADHYDNLSRMIDFYIESKNASIHVGSFYYIEGVETEVDVLVRYLESYFKGTFEDILNSILLGGTLVSKSLGLSKPLLRLIESDHFQAEQSLLEFFNLKSTPRQ